MKRLIVTGATIGIILTLVVAAPAQADTVTTSTVSATTAADITNPPLPFALPVLLPAGPIAFPVTVVGSGSAPGATLSPGLAAAGCSRVVNSFTLAVTAAPLATVAGVQLANVVNGTNVASSNFTYSGAGSATESGGVITLVLQPAATSQGGQVTFVYPAAVAIADLNQLVAFLQPATWSIDAASFSVTDTCATATAAAGSQLAASGVDAAPLLLASGGLIVGGALVVLVRVRVLGLARRRYSQADFS